MVIVENPVIVWVPGEGVPHVLPITGTTYWLPMRQVMSSHTEAILPLFAVTVPP